ncbi:MAG: hypothetical protein AB1898_27195 [Acidobacteriota bacterium]
MAQAIHRRTVIAGGSLALGSLVLDGAGFELGAWPESGKKKFNHRGYLGWITDLASEPDPDAAWPSMRLDERLLADYRETFGLMKRLGFNEMSVWGLYVSRSWPVDISSAVPAARGKLVEQLIEAAHQNSVRVYSGLGVYSWGFDEIIQAHPKLTRGNPQAMCASEPESWRWMQRVVDFVFERFDIDGVSMQSADQGRCSCDECKRYSDAEYHALLNVRTGEYIRSRWPGKTVAVNSWGMRFEEPETLPSLVKISRTVDYLIDVHDTSRKRDLAYRRKIIDALSCDFGTLGGPQVEPPQHWRRDRWLLPTLKQVGVHLQELASEGGKACEYFFHILDNPGDELSTWLAGKVLSSPEESWEQHLEDSVEQLYRTSRRTTTDALTELFLDAEEAYFKHMPPRMSGTISMEPLVTDKAGFPIYLTKRLNPDQRQAYASDLQRLRQRAERLLPDVPEKARMKKVVSCLTNVLKDLEEPG